MENEINGVIVVNKPQHMTSHDVVAIMRKKFKTKKIGHTGTLDPMATGVLPICIGKATKIVDFLTDQKKAYRAQMLLGSETDTQDQWGTVVRTIEADHVTEDMYRSVILSFLGDIYQIPPMYSALKVNGEKLVDLARKGIVVEREARLRTIHEINDIQIDGNKATFTVVCSKGTYIRTLCHDIGLKLKTVAHMTSLERVLSAPFDIENSISMDAIRNESLESLTENVVAIDKALACFPKIVLPQTDNWMKRILNGIKVDLADYVILPWDERDRFYRVYIADSFYGIAEKQEHGIYVKKLMIG